MRIRRIRLSTVVGVRRTCCRSVCFDYACSRCQLSIQILGLLIMAKNQSSKICKGCRTPVVHPIECTSCDVVSHPGQKCLARTGHPWFSGVLLDCGNNISIAPADDLSTGPALSPSPSTLCQANNGSISAIIREELQSLFASFRAEIIEVLKSDINKLSSDISSLSLRVSDLEGKLVSSNVSSSVLSDEEIIGELQDRETRSFNLIVANVSESSQSHDTSLVKNILNQIHPVDLSGLKVSRIGRKLDNRPRLFRATLSSKTEVLSILRGKTKYKGPAKIYQDSTPRKD